jgi:hypothetical protein
MKTKTSFRDLYSLHGFRARARFKCGVFGDPKARVVPMERRQKKAPAPTVGDGFMGSATGERIAPAIWTLETSAFFWTSNTGAWPVPTAA